MGPIAENSRSVRATRRLALAGLAVTALSVMIAGCSPAYMSKESLSDVRSIEIDTHVAVLGSLSVDGPLTTTEMLLGYQPTNIGRSFSWHMETHGIEVEQILLSAFRRHLMEQGRFELREDGDATLELEVGSYGFRMPALYIGNQRKVMLTVAATLKAKDSTVMWKQQDSTIFYPNLTTDYYIHVLLAEPEVVEKSLEQASCVLAYLLLSKLYPMPVPPIVSSIDTREESREVLLQIPACDSVS